MTKEKFRNLLDLIPLLILTISAALMIWTVFTQNYSFFWQQLLGLPILAIDICLFFWRHKTGIVFLGITLLLGLFGIISLSYPLYTSRFYFGHDTSGISLYYGDPIYFLWLLIYFILSNRHFYQLDTKKFWIDLFAKSSDKTP